jgi:hypothetical protein
MASITSLESLFELAATDWNFTPPAQPVEGGGTAQVVSRTITVEAVVEDTHEGPGADPLGALGSLLEHTVPLSYSPARTVLTHPGILRLPASFSGAVSGLAVSISDVFGTAGYDVVIELPNQSPPFSFTLPSPGGQATSGLAPSTFVGITLLDTTIDGKPAAKVMLSNYAFLLTLKKA